MHRLAEIDIARGLAVIGMVVFHFIFDLTFFNLASFDLDEGILFWLARSVAFTFVFLAGASSVLHYHRKKDLPAIRRRGVYLFAWGMLLTLATGLIFPTLTIWFGVLHLIGVSLVLSPFFISRSRASLVGGLIIFASGILLSLPPLEGAFPHWVGVFPFSFPTFDYFPLFPWFGVFLLGIACSHYFIAPRIAETFPRTVHSPILRVIQWAGRHSLGIYLLHQPVFLMLVGVLGGL